MDAALLIVALALTGEAPAVPDPESYAVALQRAQTERRPLVVYLGARWCPPCTQMKREVLPVLRQRPWFPRIAFACVDTDAQPALTRSLAGEPLTIPQVVVYQQQADQQWRRTSVIGYHSADDLEGFLLDRLGLNESAGTR